MNGHGLGKENAENLNLARAAIDRLVSTAGVGGSEVAKRNPSSPTQKGKMSASSSKNVRGKGRGRRGAD